MNSASIMTPIIAFVKSQQKIFIVVVLVAAMFIFGEVFQGHFLSVEQVFLTVKMASLIALFGLAQMVVIGGGGGGLDLSVGYVASLTAVLSASIMDGKPENLWPAILMALALGIGIGLVNGFLAAYVNLPPLVVTMAMANIVQGIINVYAAGSNITGKPSPILQTIAAKSTGVVPNIFFLLVIVAVIVYFLTAKTNWGLRLYGVGTNETAAYLSGINVKAVRCISFIVSGAVSGLMGLILIGNMGNAFKDMGTIYVMPSIASVVVGGTPLSGGEGNYIGVIMGAVFIQTLTNLLVAIGGGDAVKWISFGIVLFVMITFYARQKRRI